MFTTFIKFSLRASRKMIFKTIDLDDIGSVIVKKNNRAKRLTLSVKPFSGITLSIPTSVSYHDAYKFLLSNIDWLKKSKNKIKQVEKEKYIYTEQDVFITKYHQLKILKSSYSAIKSQVKDGVIRVYCPQNLEVSDHRIQSIILKCIQTAYKKEALACLPKKIYELASKFSLNYSNIKINSAKTRWGSCTVTNSINISCFVMKLPEKLINYVLLHELAHTLEKNHSIRFWNTLEEICPGARILDKELKNYHIK